MTEEAIRLPDTQAIIRNLAIREDGRLCQIWL